MTLAEFLKYYNSNLSAGFPKATNAALQIFKKEHPKLFQKHNHWSKEEHRKDVIDWLPTWSKNKIKYPYYSNRNIVKVDNAFLKNLGDALSKVYISKNQFSVTTPFTKYREKLYIFHSIPKRHYFNEEILFHDFINLDLKNFCDPGTNIIDLDNQSVERIIHFIGKYGVDFIEHDNEEDLDEYNYFSRFTYIWSMFKTLQILMETDKTIPYSKSTKRYKNTGLIVKEFQKSIIDLFLSKTKKMPTTQDKEELKNIYGHYDHPVTLLFEYLLRKGSKNLIRKCSYCGTYFTARRQDAKGCSSHHNALIRAKRSRSKQKRTISKK